MNNKKTIIVVLISLTAGIIIGSYLSNSYASKKARKADEAFFKKWEKDEKEFFKANRKFTRERN